MQSGTSVVNVYSEMATELRHDPDRHRAYLQQCLRQDKAPIGFLLSAGCPMSMTIDGQPLIPDIVGMTKRVVDTVGAGEDKAAFEKLRGSCAEDANVEDLLSRVRALQGVVGDGSVHDLRFGDLAALERSISVTVAGLASADLPTGGSTYRTLAAWAGAVQRESPVEVFTTNYDLLMEQALERARVPYFDGFVGSHQPFFDVGAIELDEVPPRWARVWKLHGSVNWRRAEAGLVTRVSGSSSAGEVLIHPSHLKYEESRRMPYLAMLDRLKAFLRRRGASLIICGYSFSDEHLNEVILQGLSANPTASAFALQFSDLQQYEKAASLAKGRSNLSLLARDGAVVGTREGKWRGADPETQSEFPYGDFAEFGGLVAELIGTEQLADSDG